MVYASVPLAPLVCRRWVQVTVGLLLAFRIPPPDAGRRSAPQCDRRKRWVLPGVPWPGGQSLKGPKGNCRLPTACKNTLLGAGIGQYMGKILTPWKKGTVWGRGMRQKGMSSARPASRNLCPAQVQCRPPKMSSATHNAGWFSLPRTHAGPAVPPARERHRGSWGCQQSSHAGKAARTSHPHS